VKQQHITFYTACNTTDIDIDVSYLMQLVHLGGIANGNVNCAVVIIAVAAAATTAVVVVRDNKRSLQVLG